MYYVGGKRVSFREPTTERNVRARTNSPLDAAWDAARELFALTDKASLDAEAIVAAQQKAINVLLEQLGDRCKISGFGDEMTVSFSCDFENAPVRELLLLVAVYASSPAMMHVASELVKAMAENQQIVHHPHWNSDEAREAVRTLHKAGFTLETEKNAWKSEVAYLKKTLPETASAIVTLVRRAKLETELNAEYVEAFDCVDDAIGSAVDEAAELLATGSVFEANASLERVAGLTPAPVRLADGQFANNVAERLVRRAFHSNPSPKLLETLYQRDKHAYIKIAVADGLHMIVAGRERAKGDLTVLMENVTRVIEVCAKDRYFLELVKKSPMYIGIYRELTGSELPPD